MLNTTITITGGDLQQPVTGTVDRAYTYDPQKGESCARFAQLGYRTPGDDTQFPLPDPAYGQDGAGGPLGAATVQIQAEILTYHGPGTCQGTDQVTVDGVDINPTDTFDHTRTWQQGDQSQLAVTMKPDGSGTATLSGLVKGEDGPRLPPVTVSMTWTCAPEPVASP